jgi:hypothetical protein
VDRGDQRRSERREFLKRAAYTAPAILSLQAVSAAAKAGSEKWAEDASEQPSAKWEHGKKKQNEPKGLKKGKKQKTRERKRED